MTDELKPIRCGCGGEAEVKLFPLCCGIKHEEIEYFVVCKKCRTRTEYKDTVAEAIIVWNRAMGERTVKVKNITHVRGYPHEGKCSNCGFDVYDDGEYCPGCGARLEWNEF